MASFDIEANMEGWPILTVRWLSRVVGLYIVYYVAHATYLGAFHPLAKYPGPFLAKFSGWPSFWYTTKGDRHLWFARLHEEYGPIVRYRYDSVAIATPSAFQDIHRSDKVRKSDAYKVFYNKSVNSFACVDREEHTRRRRVINEALSGRTLKASEPWIIKHTDRWCELLTTDSKDWSGPRNMTEWSNWLIFDIIVELCYGKSINIKEPGRNEFRTIPSDIGAFMTLRYCVKKSPFAGLWVWAKPYGLDKLFQIMAPQQIQNYVNFVEKSVNERLDIEEKIENGDLRPEREDMLHFLFKARNEGAANFTRADLLEEADVLTIGGSDTTATALAGLFFYLTRCDRAYNRLAREIRSTFKDTSEIKMGSKLSSCQYLQAVIKETLRNSPPGLGEFPRQALSGGITIDGEFFPEGTVLASSVYTLHHDPNVYTDPFTFRPERWLADESTAEEIALAESAFNAFSVGARTCPGRNFANTELSIILGKVFLLCDFSCVPGDTLGEGRPGLGWGRQIRAHFQLKDYFSALRNGPAVRFRPRT